MYSYFNKNKKWVLPVSLVVLIFFLTSFGDDGNPPSEKDWEQDPPIAEKIFVRKLDKPGPNGENMVIEVKYPRGIIRDGYVALFPNENQKITLYDDGDREKHGDEKGGDDVFTMLVKEDLTGFENQMMQFDETLRKNDNLLDVFTGRVGEIVERKDPLFDREKFNSFGRIELSRDIFRLRPNTEDIRAQFIPEEVRVGDYNSGNPTFPTQMGAYRTNGPLARTMLGWGPPPPPPPPPAIIKANSLLITALSVVHDPARTFNPCNGAFGSGNPNGAWTFGTLMKGMAFQSSTGISAREFTKHWLRRWMVDTTINGEFVKNRSSKMLSMVITRWIRKARHNNALPVTAANWQTEWDNTHQDSLMRYAPFSLKAIVNRLDLRGNFGYSGGSSNSGETRFIFSVVQNTTTGNCRDSLGAGGFDGFNVIFEYGNPQTKCSAVQALGWQWANLSTMALGSPAYNAALESITHLVTDSNRAPGKPNKSALNQLRTNEIALTNAATTAGDKSPRWQFREFKIQANKHLEEVPTHNEPANRFNGADGATPADAAILAGWVNGNAANIIAQNTAGNVPLNVGATPFQAGKVNYASTSPLLAPGFWNGSASGAGFITNDSARLFFSLNTCTGCHSADTRTDFTEVDYKGDNTPYTGLSGTVGVLVAGTQHKVDISPFLTGRDANIVGGTPVAGDDSTGTPEDLTDFSLTGLFYVKDAANRTYPGTGVVRKWGFNDLQRRSQDLTNLITTSCSPILVVSLAQIAFFQPLNMSH